MSQARCEDCGEYVFFNAHVSSSGRTTHGDCEKAAERLREMPVAYDAAIQALVRVSERAGRFVSEAEDRVWSDPKELQAVLLDVASDGIKWPE